MNGSGSSSKRDYSGVATAQLAEIYRRYSPYSNIGIFAEKIGMDKANLKKILVTQDYAFTGLQKADEILVGIGLNISALEATGELTVVPGDEKWHCAERMAEDAQWAREVMGAAPMDGAEKQALIGNLKRLRTELCSQSVEQRVRLDQDAARSKARRLRES